MNSAAPKMHFKDSRQKISCVELAFLLGVTAAFLLGVTAAFLLGVTAAFLLGVTAAFLLGVTAWIKPKLYSLVYWRNKMQIFVGANVQNKTKYCHNTYSSFERWRTLDELLACCRRELCTECTLVQLYTFFIRNHFITT